MLNEDDMKKPSAEDQKVADAMMDELEALMKPGSVYVSLICNTVFAVVSSVLLCTTLPSLFKLSVLITLLFVNHYSLLLSYVFAFMFPE